MAAAAMPAGCDISATVARSKTSCAFLDRRGSVSSVSTAVSLSDDMDDNDQGMDAESGMTTDESSFKTGVGTLRRIPKVFDLAALYSFDDSDDEHADAAS
mmetsp:Transcript_86160/g.244313  ORF Transcript_86160/g.244313 Transcript_86160/m.244313 type:complete len:100 (+) Transcript_86160:54-353(+)